MNQAQLIDAISDHLEGDISKGHIDRVLKAACAVATGHLRDAGQGEHVTMPGIGTIYKKLRKGRTGRNPQTGDAIEIAARFVPDFRPAKPLRDALENSDVPA